jgi:ubiquinone/menaquinone biosynthesis C-methylase UbiE
MSNRRPAEGGEESTHATEQQYLIMRQYRDASNLNARGALHARFTTNPYPWFRWLFDQLLTLAPADARILEVGAGPAGLWTENLDRLPPGWRITLTDLSDGMVAIARERLAAPGVSADTFTLQTADVEQLPFAAASFDVAIANHMLYHVPNQLQALGDLRRVLRPGGAFLAATNGQDHLRELNELLIGFDPAVQETPWRASVRSPFTLESGAEQFAPYFDAIEMRPYEGDLRVTEIDAVVAYARSIDMPGLSEPEQQTRFAQYLSKRLAAAGGVFIIARRFGAFSARARPSQ